MAKSNKPKTEQPSEPDAPAPETAPAPGDAPAADPSPPAAAAFPFPMSPRMPAQNGEMLIFRAAHPGSARWGRVTLVSNGRISIKPDGEIEELANVPVFGSLTEEQRVTLARHLGENYVWVEWTTSP